jgi:hypothetical protein
VAVVNSIDRTDLPPARESRFWRIVLTLMLRAAPTGVMRRVRARDPKVPIDEFIIVGRRSGEERHYLLNHLQVDGGRYVGHPNGSSQWVRNLVAAGGCTMIDRAGTSERVTATELPDGPERDAVIASTGHMPPPAGIVYGAASRHIRAVGRFFRIEAAG